ncbi:MAG: class I SAM-dependent methyltransferase [Solirubrobacterales bacterium]|nr:class I SAM-dependent methyltransferase [Solirubrobacterales bacterium]
MPDVRTLVPEPVRALIPGALKRRHEAWSTRRFLRSANAVNERYVERYGLEVRRGPFAGLRYLPELMHDSGDNVAKMVGTYELEVYGVLRRWIDRGLDHVVDVGCAEGFYAVGLAVASPATTVHAYDIEPRQRERCARLAAHNGVAARVRIGDACPPEALAAFPPDGVALLIDAEGYERTLLDPAAAPRLLGWEVLVELHDFIDPSISALVRRRFAPSHEIEVFDAAPRTGLDLPELDELAPGERALILSERRPAAMQWAWLRPRGQS